MMGLAWRSLELRIKRDPEFRRQMIEKYRQACRDNTPVREQVEPPQDCRRLQLLRDWSHDEEGIDEIRT